jgi:hypothetical protein
MTQINAAVAARLISTSEVQAAPQKSALERKLKDARAKVNKLEFGTPEWEKAMEVVRGLTSQINSLTDFGSYTSHEGDVFAPR